MYGKVRLYLARSMTGRVKEDVVAEALKDKEYLETAGFEVLCPVISEKVEPTKQVLLSSKAKMDEYWPRDKAMIRAAHLVLDMTPAMKSEGVAHELGYARYHLWKPVVRVYSDGKLPVKSSVAYYEDDFIASSLLEAVGYIHSTHGTLLRRFKWRFAMYSRCLLKAWYYKLREWK